MFAKRLGNRHEDDAGLLKLLPERCRHRNRIEHGIHSNSRSGGLRRAAGIRSRISGTFNPKQDFRFPQRDTKLFVSLEDFLWNIVDGLVFRASLGRCVVINVLVVDLLILDHCPVRLFHGQPALIGFQAPLQHPCWLAFLFRDEPNNIPVEPFRRVFSLDVRGKPGRIILRLQRFCGCNGIGIDAILNPDIVSHVRLSPSFCAGQRPPTRLPRFCENLLQNSSNHNWCGLHTPQVSLVLPLQPAPETV